jgi:hypothetical protein
MKVKRGGKIKDDQTKTTGNVLTGSVLKYKIGMNIAFCIVFAPTLKSSLASKSEKKKAWRHRLQAFFIPRSAPVSDFHSTRIVPANKLLK